MGKELLSGIVRFIVIFVMWVLLTWSLDVQEVIAGLIVSLLVAVLFRKMFIRDMTFFLSPVRWLWLLYYIPVFLYYMVKANLDVAYRVLHIDVPINPGIVKVRTSLKSEIGRVFLANSITLTPGTLTVDFVGDHLYIHWINIKTENPEEETRIIVRKFEKILKKVWD